tara:strand:- start:58 stop:234 length:177 start_codon:yes stop_codon:yes gene_type:complete
MKHFIIFTLATAALIHVGGAGLKVPRSVFKMSELESAKTEAIESEKPLIFVYTDPGTT